MRRYNIATESVVNLSKLRGKDAYLAMPGGGVKNWKDCSTTELIAAGYLEYVEDTIEQDYLAGIPSDIVTATMFHRTYPNQTLDTEAVRHREISNATSELAKLDAYMPRGLEDLCDSDASVKDKLSQFNKDRMDRKQILRAIIAGV